MKENREDDLNKIIVEKLDSEEIESNSEYINLYDLVNLCHEEMKSYNDYFSENIKSRSKKINNPSRVHGFFNENILFIHDVIPEVINDKSIVNIIFENSNERYAGEMEITNDGVRLLNFDEKKYNNNQNIVFLDKCSESFKVFLKVLDYFRNNYRGIDFRWDRNHPSDNAKLDVYSDDKMLHASVNLGDIKHTFVNLNSFDDILVATSRSSKYGILYDYIEFYNEALQRRLKVNVNDLNPMYREIYNKNENTISLTKKQ